MYGDVPYYRWELEEEIEPTQTILASVCRFWEEVLYGSKRLWTRINLNQDEDRWRLHMKMSQGLYRQVIWDTEKCWSSAREQAGPAAELGELAPDIDSLDIADHHEQLQRAFKVDLHALRHLKISQMEEPYGVPERIPVLTMPLALTMLRSLTLV